MSAPEPTSTPLPLDGRLWTTEQAAQYLGFAKRTLEDMRWKGGGPLFVKLAHNRVGYRKTDLDDWIEARVAASTTGARFNRPRFSADH